MSEGSHKVDPRDSSRPPPIVFRQALGYQEKLEIGSVRVGLILDRSSDRQGLEIEGVPVVIISHHSVHSLSHIDLLGSLGSLGLDGVIPGSPSHNRGAVAFIDCDHVSSVRVGFTN